MQAPPLIVKNTGGQALRLKSRIICGRFCFKLSTNSCALICPPQSLRNSLYYGLMSALSSAPAAQGQRNVSASITGLRLPGAAIRCCACLPVCLRILPKKLVVFALVTFNIMSKASFETLLFLFMAYTESRSCRLRAVCAAFNRRIGKHPHLKSGLSFPLLRLAAGAVQVHGGKPKASSPFWLDGNTADIIVGER